VTSVLALTNGSQAPAASTHAIVVAPEVMARNCVKMLSPAYPGMARTARVAGNVLLRVTISKSGDVVSAESTSGHPLLIYSAIATVKEWKYKSYLAGGRAVEVSTQVKITFDPAAPDRVVSYPNGAPPAVPQPSAAPLGLDTSLVLNKAFDQTGRLRFDAGPDRVRDWTVDRAGNVYLVNSENRSLSRISAATGEKSAIVGELREPSGTVKVAELARGLIAVDGSGNVYVNADFGEVFRISARTGEATLLGSAMMTKDGPASQIFVSLIGLAVDADGDLYMAVNGAIRRKSAATGITTEAAQISGSAGVEFTVDPAGNLYLNGENAIRKIAIETGRGTTIKGRTSDGGLAVDAAGNIYFASKDGFWKINGTTALISRIAAKPPAYQAGKFRVDGGGNLYVACQGYIQRFPISQTP
jgi:TonB family protein